MLILPSVGATVQRIVLNEDASAAKLLFSDGSTAVIRTKNTPTTKKTAIASKIPNGKLLAKKKLVKKPGMTSMSTTSVIKTHQGSMPVSMIKNPEAMAKAAGAVIERAKKRAEILESKTMDSSARLGLSAQDGQEYSP